MRGKKTALLAGGGDGEVFKRPRGKTNFKVDDIRDTSSMALHETLHGMMSHKDVRDEKKRQSKDEQMKQYRELQRKRGKKTAKFAGGGDGEALKRPRGKTNSKVDDIRDAPSMVLHETL